MAAPYTSLTSRQREVMIELTRDGGTNRVIGERLHLSPDTIKYHVVAMLAVTGCETRTALVLWWIRRGQYEEPDPDAL